MKIDKIKDVSVTDDGNHARIEFQGLSTIALEFSFEQLQNLVRECAQTLVGVRFNRGTHSDTPNEFAARRETILVDKMEVALQPDGSIDFLIESKGRNPIQVSLHDIHGKALRDLLAGNGSEHRLA